MKKFLILPFLFLICSSAFSLDFDCNFIFDEGVSFCQVTRIEKLEDRSNFVRENMMLGAYFSTQTAGLPLCEVQLDVSAYYPFYQAFNGMKQVSKNVLNYALDSYLGLKIEYDVFKYVIFTGSLGMHYMYQLTDEWHMHYLGLGLTTGFELPISKGWTIVNRNFFSYDDANLGTNKFMQRFRASYQYHINLGFRYSRRVHNEYSYISGTPEQSGAPEQSVAPELVEGSDSTDAL